jgi:hypothetical protein
MTDETLEAVALGQAEALIEIMPVDTLEENMDKSFEPVAPYIEFEGSVRASST